MHLQGQDGLRPAQQCSSSAAPASDEVRFPQTRVSLQGGDGEARPQDHDGAARSYPGGHVQVKLGRAMETESRTAMIASWDIALPLARVPIRYGLARVFSGIPSLVLARVAFHRTEILGLYRRQRHIAITRKAWLLLLFPVLACQGATICMKPPCNESVAAAHGCAGKHRVPDIRHRRGIIEHHQSYQHDMNEVTHPPRRLHVHDWRHFKQALPGSPLGLTDPGAV